MDAGLALGNNAVIQFDLDRLALDNDALDQGAVGGDADALGDGGRIRVRRGSHADSERNFGGGVARVCNVDGDQPVARRAGFGVDAVDAQVGQALVGIHPIGEEPANIERTGGLDELLLKPTAGSAGAQRGGERLIAGHCQRK